MPFVQSESLFHKVIPTADCRGAPGKHLTRATVGSGQKLSLKIKKKIQNERNTNKCF